MRVVAHEAFDQLAGFPPEGQSKPARGDKFSADNGYADGTGESADFAAAGDPLMPWPRRQIASFTAAVQPAGAAALQKIDGRS